MKIPFERTLVGAYRFALTNLLSIFGIAWFPFAIVGCVAVGLFYSLLPVLNTVFSTTMDKWDETQAVPFFSSMLGALALLIVVVFVAHAMVMVGLMRKALGQQPEPVYFYFSLGAPVWRMIGAYVLLLLLAWGATIAFAVGIGLIVIGFSRVSQLAQSIVTFVLMVTAIFGGIYAFVRVQFFLPAVVVAERHIGLRRSWNLGRGNFWRIVGITILVTLPAYIVFSTCLSIAMQFALAGHTAKLAAFNAHAMNGSPTPAEMREYFMTIVAVLKSSWPILVLLELVYFAALIGLSAGAIATAYNLVNGQSGDAPVVGAAKAGT